MCILLFGHLYIYFFSVSAQYILYPLNTRKMQHTKIYTFTS